jgi:membrane protein YqaA with SNARE-associated domain
MVNPRRDCAGRRGLLHRRRMMRRLYNWIMTQAAGPHATPVLAFLSFLESSVFPIPPDVMLVPMCLANRARAFFYALVCTVSSVLGGLLGYAIGFYLIETVGRAIIHFYGLDHAFEEYQAMFQDWGLWIILIKGLTPIPYKVVTIASGAASFDLAVFVLASITTRGLRFYLEALLLRVYGEPIREFIEKRLNQLTWIFLACLIGGFVAIRFVF